MTIDGHYRCVFGMPRTRVVCLNNVILEASSSTMSANQLKLVKIHDHPHLIDQCVKLLNQQWPRKDSIRLQSIRKSCEDFPMCLALVDDHDHVYGFVKLTKETISIKTIFVHSLVIEPNSRGKGLGRMVMREVESIAKQGGFQRISLLSKDCEIFYRKLGYVPLFNQVSKLTTVSREAVGHLPPPPPPPPPSSLSSPDDKTLMIKDI